MKRLKHSIVVVALSLCGIQLQGQVIFSEDFGTGTGVVSELESMMSKFGEGYKGFDGSAKWAKGDYTIAPSTDALRGLSPDADKFKDWVVAGLKDHTPGDVNGRMLMVDGRNKPGLVYESYAIGLCKNTELTFSFWVANINGENAKQNNPSATWEKERSNLQVEVWTKNPHLESQKDYKDLKDQAKQLNFMKNTVVVDYEAANGAKLLAKTNYLVPVPSGKYPTDGTQYKGYRDSVYRAGGQEYIYLSTGAGTSSVNLNAYKVYKQKATGMLFCTNDGRHHYAVTEKDKTLNKNADSSVTHKLQEKFYQGSSITDQFPDHEWHFGDEFDVYTGLTSYYRPAKLDGKGYKYEGYGKPAGQGYLYPIYTDATHDIFASYHDGHFHLMERDSVIIRNHPRVTGGDTICYFPKFKRRHEKDTLTGGDFPQTNSLYVASETDLVRRVANASGDGQVYAYLNDDMKLKFFVTWGSNCARPIEPNYDLEMIRLADSWEDFNAGLDDNFEFHDDATIEERWNKVELTYLQNEQGSVYIIIRDFSETDSRNDFAIDDIKFEQNLSYNFSATMSAVSRNLPDYCNTGDVTMSTTLHVTDANTGDPITDEQKEELNSEVTNYVVRYYGTKNGVTHLINDNVARFTDLDHTADYYLPVTVYNFYDGVHSEVFPYIYSNTGCRLTVSDTLTADIDIPENMPEMLLEVPNHCADSGTMMHTVTVDNANDANKPWRARLLMEDGTIVDVKP